MEKSIDDAIIERIVILISLVSDIAFAVAQWHILLVRTKENKP